jgi:hypothetical protein
MHKDGSTRPRPPALALALVLSAAVAACGRPGREGAAAPAGGGVVLSGRASPNARIRADTLDKAAYGVTAADDGRFVLELPPSRLPRLVAVSVEGPRRSTPAQGWLFIPPDRPERAVLLRPGAGARAYPGAGLLATVDYDPAGGVAVSGVAAKNVPVEVSVDGGEFIASHSDAEGRWTARLPAALTPGAHELRARAGGVQVERQVDLSPPRASKAFAAEREKDDWRVDWIPPGGGSQTTLVLIGGRA